LAIAELEQLAQFEQLNELIRTIKNIEQPFS